MSPLIATDDDIRAAAAGRPLQPIRGDGTTVNYDVGRMLDLAALTNTPGTYHFRMRVMGNRECTVFLKPQTVVTSGGAITVTLEKRLSDGVTLVGAAATPDVALASGVLSTLKRSDLDGDEYAYLKIVVPGTSTYLTGTGAAEFKTFG